VGIILFNSLDASKPFITGMDKSRMIEFRPMLQGEIHRLPTVACFRADVLIFLSFKNLTEHLAHQWIVIGDQYGPSHAAFAAGRVTLALSFFFGTADKMAATP
jgi:hypothetical protein